MNTTSAEHLAWTKQGSVDASKRTYASVRAALEGSPRLDGISYEIFLQGSYANNTNTRGDSDVDIVVMMTSTIMPETTRLSASQTEAYERNRIPGRTSFQDLRTAVDGALRDYYGTQRVVAKNKCITVTKRDGYVDADVVPAMQHRLYTSYESWGSANWIEGISIQPLTGSRIVNYPKEHRRNGEAKNGEASGLYKPTVRQVKRLRRKAVGLGLVGKKDAPGYLLECLVSNVPNSSFVADPSDRLKRVLAYLSIFDAEGLAESMWSGDRIHRLFVDDPGQHNEYTARRTIKTLWDLY